jgi:hypothetical protein
MIDPQHRLDPDLQHSSLAWLNISRDIKRPTKLIPGRPPDHSLVRLDRLRQFGHLMHYRVGLPRASDDP